MIMGICFLAYRLFIRSHCSCTWCHLLLSHVLINQSVLLTQSVLPKRKIQPVPSAEPQPLQGQATARLRQGDLPAVMSHLNVARPSEAGHASQRHTTVLQHVPTYFLGCRWCWPAPGSTSQAPSCGRCSKHWKLPSSWSSWATCCRPWPWWRMLWLPSSGMSWLRAGACDDCRIAARSFRDKLLFDIQSGDRCKWSTLF